MKFLWKSCLGGELRVEIICHRLAKLSMNPRLDAAGNGVLADEQVLTGHQVCEKSPFLSRLTFFMRSRSRQASGCGTVGLLNSGEPSCDAFHSRLSLRERSVCMEAKQDRFFKMATFNSTNRPPNCYPTGQYPKY